MTKLEQIFEEMIESAIESVLDSKDFSDDIERAVDDYDFSSGISDALENYDFSDVVTRLKDEIQEEVTDELKDTLYEAMLKKLEPLLKTQQAGLVPVENDNAEARPKVRVTLNLTFERDFIADCVKIGKPNPTPEELQCLIRNSLQPFLQQEGEVGVAVTEPAKGAA